MRSDARSSRTPSGTRGFAADPLFRTRRLLGRRADRLTPRQRTRITAALEAGDPNGEVAAAWLVAQQLMAAYADHDRAAGKAAADKAITTAKTCLVPEINRLGRTLIAWRTRVPRPLRPAHRLQRADRMPQPEDQKHQADSLQLPVLRQLPSATTSQPRTYPRRSTNDADQIPPTQQDCVEPPKPRSRSWPSQPENNFNHRPTGATQI